MVICDICGETFKSKFGGVLTNHIIKEHSLTMEDYYIKTKLNGVSPKCACGYCNETPRFYRGYFKKYAKRHNLFKWQEKKYLELFGTPKCINANCNNEVKFFRGKPRQYCSFKCLPNNWNQEKVKKTVQERYGVDNVFMLEDVKEKIKTTAYEKYGIYPICRSERIKKKIKETNIILYGTSNIFQNEDIKKKIKKTVQERYGVDHISKTDKFREMASKNICKYNENIHSNHKLTLFKNTNLYYQSMYEYEFLELCENLNIINEIDNGSRYNYLNDYVEKYHIPDFKYKNDKYIIEIKSTYWYYRQGGDKLMHMKKESVEATNGKYVMILDKNYDEFLEIVKMENKSSYL
jgi:hypothetical protein